VWTEEDQWQPLWDDIERVVETVLDAERDSARLADIPPHFLGAVVLKQRASMPGEPMLWEVIDGQQRLTTLQILLDAAQLMVEKHGDLDAADLLHEMVGNHTRRFAKTPHRFKLWPSRTDQAAFEHAMDNNLSVTPELADARIVQAHRFFATVIADWAAEADEGQGRLAALTDVLLQRLTIVSIRLGERDDEQLIFETLNDRGTPLLAADLVKNIIFRRADQLRVDVDDWAESYWSDFDDSWWRGTLSQGRLYRSRIDILLQYWLTMRTRTEIPSDMVYKRFEQYAASLLTSVESARELLTELRRDADTFRRFAQLDDTTAAGRFYNTVIEALELGATTPLLLWLISENHAIPDGQSSRALKAMESWVVRRTILRRTMKDVNKLVVTLLAHLDRSDPNWAGDAVIKFLEEQTADARAWPSDDELVEQLPQVRAYGNIRQPRLRAILGAVEGHFRTARHESVSLPDRLELEHIMPRKWREHWNADAAGATPDGRPSVTGSWILSGI